MDDDLIIKQRDRASASASATDKAIVSDLAMDIDVLHAAIHLQTCKNRGARNGHVVFHFTPEGKINLDAIEERWMIRLSKKS